MSDTITAEPLTDLDDKWPATVTASIHILVGAPVIEFNPMTYPSLIIGEHQYGNARFQLTLTGSAEQRAEAARRLHEVADAIAAWTKP